jgi:hypothetical protein
MWVPPDAGCTLEKPRQCDQWNNLFVVAQSFEVDLSANTGAIL